MALRPVGCLGARKALEVKLDTKINDAQMRAEQSSQDLALAQLEALRSESEEGNADPSLDFRIAVILHGMGRWADAERAFCDCEMNSIREAGGNYLEASILGRVECLRSLGRVQEAREVLERAPESAQLWLGSLVSRESLSAALESA